MDGIEDHEIQGPTRANTCAAEIKRKDSSAKTMG